MKNYNYLTIELKNIIPSTFTEWKELIDPYINRFNIMLEDPISEKMLTLCYNLIYNNFINSYIRYQTPEAFWRAIAQAIVNYVPRWNVLINWIQLEYKLEYEKLIGGAEKTIRSQNTKDSGTTESAATPATQVTANMIEDYIDTKSTTSGETDVSENIERTNLFDALSKIEQIDNIHDMLLGEIRGTFAKHFMQITLEAEKYGNL